MFRWASSTRGSALDRVEAPVTLRGYLLCVFAAFGGILFGYDSGYINGVLGMNYFKQQFGRESFPCTQLLRLLSRTLSPN
jgi:hypothetical protein